MNLIKLQVYLATFFVTLGGCALSRTVVSPSDAEISYPLTSRHVTGEDCAYNFLGIPASDHLNPSLRRAIDGAAAKAPDSYALTDMTVKRETLVGLIYNQECLKVLGTPVAQTTGSRYLDQVRREFDWSD